MVGLMTLYFVNGRVLDQIDCVPAPYQAWSIAQRGTLNLWDYAELAHLINPTIFEAGPTTWYYTKAPGTLLTSVPLIAPLAWMNDHPLPTRDMAHVGKVIAAFHVAASVLIFSWIARRVAPRGAQLATILFAFGTSAWSTGSQALWTHGPAIFWTTLALALLFSRGLPSSESSREVRSGVWGWGIALGFALGMGVDCRQSNVFFVLATLAFFPFVRPLREIPALLVGLALPALAMIAFNHALFGSIIGGGYAQELAGPRFISDGRVGLAGLLIAPSRGVFVYTPAFLLAPLALVGAHRCRRANAPWLWSWALAAFAIACFYSSWHDWKGGWCFGPRFLSETAPIGCMLFAVAVHRNQGAWMKIAAPVLVSASIVVHAIGVFGYSGDWHMRHHGDDMSLFHFTDNQIFGYFMDIID